VGDGGGIRTSGNEWVDGLRPSWERTAFLHISLVTLVKDVVRLIRPFRPVSLELQKTLHWTRGDEGRSHTYKTYSRPDQSSSSLCLNGHLTSYRLSNPSSAFALTKASPTNLPLSELSPALSPSVEFGTAYDAEMVYESV